MILPVVDRRAVVEEAQGELGAQHVAGRPVHQLLGHHAGLEPLHEVPPVVPPVPLPLDLELLVDARVESEPRRVGAGRSDELQLVQAPDVAVVADDVARKSPLAAEDLLKQVGVRVHRHAVHGVVRRHQAADPGLLDRGSERRQEDFAQTPLRHVHVAGVQPCGGLAVGDEVLGRGDDAIRAVALVAETLQAGDVGHADPRHEIGILAVALLRAAPTRIDQHTEHR